MKKIISVKFLLCFIILLVSIPSFPQNKNDIEKFFRENSSLILLLAHKNSTLINSEVEVIDSDDSDFDYKVIIVIKYKGFIKNHTLKCFVYFEDYPRKFIWGTDTNSFEFNNPAEVVLEELKDKWSKYKY